MNGKSSRRHFLQAVGGAFGAAAASAFPGKLEAAEIPAKWDETFDVIVVGTGLAGMSSGITAAEKGSQTVILDKMSRLGGTSLISGLNFACVGSGFQKAQGIKDQPEWLANDMTAVSGGLGDPALALAA